VYLCGIKDGEVGGSEITMAIASFSKATQQQTTPNI
jgi:hypothetical protein